MARVLISLPDDFLAEVDAVAQRENRSRSEMIREALRRYMASAPPVLPRDEAADANAIAALEQIQRMRRDVEPEGADEAAWMKTRRDNG